MGKNDSLAKMTVVIAGQTAQFNAAMKSSQAQLSAFQKTVNGVGDYVKGFLGVAAVGAVSNFALEVTKLAGEAKGVGDAFDKLPNSIKLMEDLKTATGGTVSELELMKRAVTATNFGIGLAELPKLLEFATVRAQQTGQSVDYLVDSIVTGIGRKSPLILDNLGISTTRLKEKFGGAALEAQSIADVTRAVGQIAEEELTKMGSVSENASTKIQRLSASYENLKVAIGLAANETGILGDAIDELTRKTDILSSSNIGFLQKLVALINPSASLAAVYEDIAKQAIKSAEQQQKQNEITETATILLRDLGLDYEALMNVAGDNVNVMEIWAEMQRISADEAAKLTVQVQDQTKAVKELTKAKEKFTEEEMMAGRIAGLDRKLAGPKKETNIFGFNVNPEVSSGIDSITASYKNLGETIKALNATQEENNAKIEQSKVMWAGFAQGVGDSIAQVIAANQSFAQSFSKVAASVINQLEQIAIAKMIAKNVSLGGIFGAIAGFAVIKGLFAKLSKSNDFSSGSGFNKYGTSGLVTVAVRQRGTDLVGVGMEESRVRKRTRG